MWTRCSRRIVDPWADPPSGFRVRSGVAHVPVLLQAVLRVLSPRKGETYVDCTAGLGGHAAAVGEVVGATGTVVLNDADPKNLAMAEGRVRGMAGAPRVVALRANFADLPRLLEERSIRADMVLGDLGFASPQVDDPARGFSFSREGPQDMRMDPSLAVSAGDLVRSLPEPELARIIAEFGDEPAARAIARKLVRERAQRPIITTTDLAELVRGVVPRRPGGIDPATRTFQALRIAVNDEIGSLEALLAAIHAAARAMGKGEGAWLSRGARIAVISFHSLEDRPVKRAFSELVREKLGRDLTSGQIKASAEEVGANVRSRSATLRAVSVG